MKHKIIEGTETTPDNLTLMEMGKFCSIMNEVKEIKETVDYFVNKQQEWLLTNYIKRVLSNHETG